MSDWDNFWNNVGNAVEDVVEWVGDAAEDVGEVLEDVGEVLQDATQEVAQAATDVVDRFVDTAENAVDRFVDTAENAFDRFVDTAENAFDRFVDTAENAAEAVAGRVAAAAEAVAGTVERAAEAVAETVVDWTLPTADAMAFDSVGFITNDVVDADYEDGQLLGDLNLGVGSAGVSVGQQSFDVLADFDIGIASGEISFDSGVEAVGELHRNADGSYGAGSLVDVFGDGRGDTGASFHDDTSIQLRPDGFDASSTTEILIDGSGALADAVAVDQLSELSLVPIEIEGFVEMVEPEPVDDFTSDVISIDEVESVAEGVWDDIGQ